ncbi:hypothetical protein [Sphingobium aromaticiconvertens]|uniref:hypothetical protein n=1 Tax=Sphingobium aromaticiconvertens TaxID=365341 RepID=UPI00301AAFA7
MTVGIDLEAEQDKSKPWWFTLYPAVEAEKDEDCRPAVRVQFQPIGRIALRAARRAAGAAYIGVELPEDENAPLPVELIEAAGDAMSEALLMAGIIDWEGVGVGDDPVPVSPTALSQFLAHPLRFERLDAAYVRPWVDEELEKNASSPSLNGTSPGAAKPTAAKSARSAKTGVAKRTKPKA